MLGRPELRAITACTALTNLLWAAAGTVHRFLVFGGLGDRPPSWAVAGPTLAVAAMFQPARRRVQAVVDRRFNRRRYDAARTVEAFAARLRDQVDLDAPAHRAARGGRRDRAATRASLWLRGRLR